MRNTKLKPYIFGRSWNWCRCCCCPPEISDDKRLTASSDTQTQSGVLMCVLKWSNSLLFLVVHFSDAKQSNAAHIHRQRKTRSDATTTFRDGKTETSKTNQSLWSTACIITNLNFLYCSSGNNNKNYHYLGTKSSHWYVLIASNVMSKNTRSSV